MEKDKLILPKEFKEQYLYSGPSIMDGLCLLQNFCESDCTRESSCEKNDKLKHSIENGLPYWFKEFRMISIRTDYKIVDTNVNIFMCNSYESSQIKLPGFESGFTCGVEKVIELANKEREIYERIYEE